MGENGKESSATWRAAPWVTEQANETRREPNASCFLGSEAFYPPPATAARDSERRAALLQVLGSVIADSPD